MGNNGTVKVAIFDGSQMIAMIEASARVAWTGALATVKAHAHAAGFSGRVTWFRTVNRDGLMIEGTPFRALQMDAGAKRSPFLGVR